MLLMGLLFNQHASLPLSASTNSAPMVAMILSNQSAAAYLPTSLHRTENSPPAEVFEWTNGSRPGSRLGPLSPRKEMD
jgi:hypothetical protein